MAGNKVNAKAKGKDDRGKGSKSIVPSNEETEDTDFSLLRKPIHTSVTSFGQARKIYDLATEELQNLLSEECDLLYECKVCRNLFRSLANFISHKRVYCKEKFNNAVHGHFIKSLSTLNQLSKIRLIEEGYQDSLKELNKYEAMDMDEVDQRVPLTKDLTAVVEKISNNKGSCESNKETQVSLQKIPNSSVAVFQNVETGSENETENMRNQVNELGNILSRNVAVLQNDGQFKIQSSPPDSDKVIQISDDEDSDDLKCKKCDMQFSTQKTLRFHMKYKHVDTRLVYPCPDCLEIFSTSWSVYRHLFKVHRKTAAQIRRLRESIQSKAFKMNNPPAFYEKRKNNMKTPPIPKITEEERLDQENQAWMDNMECDGEVPRCGGCGRGFERRAALAAHTHTCPPRTRALRRPDAKRIEIQIRKDYNKGPPPVVLPKPSDVNEVKLVKEIKEESEPEPKLTKKFEEVPRVTEERKNDDENSVESLSQRSTENPTSNGVAESPEKPTDTATLPPITDKPTEQVIRLPYAQHAEKSNLMALRQRIIGDIQLEKLMCKKCYTKCGHIQELYDHVAKHYKWMRYACKLCNFKHYYFDKLPEHVKVVHKLKGDKDFYFSTVKAIDGQEALELAEPAEENTEANDTSPNSRRPSRCSSDSSRLSDDSSSSSTRIVGAKKRKIQRIPNKGIGKRRKSLIKTNNKEEEEWPDKEESPPKAFEENSSDMDETYEKSDKKRGEENTSVASRRPIRRKAKPKNADFEYDLSNLLKMEAQGYRDSQTVTTTKSSQTKKKTQPEPLSNYEILNKECCGALDSLSRKSVEEAKAHIKTLIFPLYTPKEKISANIFARPMLPKIIARSDKASPKKDTEDKKDNSDSSKQTDKEETDKDKGGPKEMEKDVTDLTATTASNINQEATTSKDQSDSKNTTPAENNDDQNNSNNTVTNKIKPKNINIPSVVPLKFRRQSLEVIKNPLINKNITEFTKAGMKTKILLIKPINRNKDGTQTLNTSLKFQTIKLKETSKQCSNDDKPSDQVVVVKVPKVDCISRSLPETTITMVPNDKAQVITEKSSITENPKADKLPVNMELSAVVTDKSNDTDKSAANDSTSISENATCVTQISSTATIKSVSKVIVDPTSQVNNDKNQTISNALKNDELTKSDDCSIIENTEKLLSKAAEDSDSCEYDLNSQTATDCDNIETKTDDSVPINDNITDSIETANQNL